MLNMTTTIAEAAGTNLAATYRHYYGDQEARFATILDAAARLIIERISTSDALYHNVEHTILVTLVGQDILRGRLLHQAVEPSDWLHFMFALLCHDIGYEPVGEVRARGFRFFRGGPVCSMLLSP